MKRYQHISFIWLIIALGSMGCGRSSLECLTHVDCAPSGVCVDGSCVAGLACSACSGMFRITEKPLKVEIQCPGCERKLRIRPKPGTKQLNCPACDVAFNVTF